MGCFPCYNPHTPSLDNNGDYSEAIMNVLPYMDKAIWDQEYTAWLNKAR
jgi:hypothetical protein